MTKKASASSQKLKISVVLCFAYLEYKFQSVKRGKGREETFFLTSSVNDFQPRKKFDILEDNFIYLEYELHLEHRCCLEWNVESMLFS